MRMRVWGSALVLSFVAGSVGLGSVALAASSSVPESVTLSAGWQLQDAAKVTQAGDAIASAKFKPQGWYSATVPGTVLTSLVNAGAYPEPLYGENSRPDKIPDSLARTQYWYRTVFEVPKTYAGRHVWLNLEGINFSAQVWVNGTQVGTMKGAFKRGIFDISTVVKPGKRAVLAVLVSPQPHPGVPHEHTIRDGVGKNGGITAIDGPTFLSTIGWDWIPAIRDRDTGIWQKVFLSASGPVMIKDPLVTTDLPLPKTDTADVSVQARVENVTDAPQKGVLKGSFGDVTFEQSVVVAAHSSQTVAVDAKNTPAMHVEHPKLWWPNGYGPQNLYKLHLSFEVDGKTSDDKDVSFGVRKFTYAVPDSENLTITVNGVRVFIRGGNWGLDEAMKRNPRERLEAQIRMHQIANLNLIRNWVGQSTSEDFYELCDKYGILVWDEFFQPNPSDGPDPDDFDTYMANVRDKILRFRNHASIVLWCARNEGYPPKKIDDALRVLMSELEPTRLYQANSADGRGVNSHGPYHWRTPREFYVYDEAFKTEIGSMSVPTLESIHGMMPEKDWETINDDWAQHDFAKGAADGDKYPAMIADRYGKVANLADFVRKSQLANYEAFRAMYEGRNAKLFHPTTGVITWMSNPAQPSFVWQLYHHDLEPNSALFAVKKAAEPVHIQLNEANGEVQVINNLDTPLESAHAHLAIYNLDGVVQYQHDFDVSAAPSLATTLGSVEWPSTLSAVHFVKLELRDATGKLISENFYWRALPEHQDDLKALGSLPVVTLGASVIRRDAEDKVFVTVTLQNTGKDIALMTHLQLRRKRSGERVLPVYYSDNYVSLLPNETRTITIEAATADLKGEDALVVLDGWNVGVTSATSAGAGVEANVGALVDHWRLTGLPTEGAR
ncbi:glycoside hydrolase family 2 TIM barrel-domain containing protein [Tunturibacter empetritectus]|uniref:Glycoside hydrolase family 2 TIM barrel-domain containing protein n=1 Tax=Tunturiibacter empetritectus TaxID=3069691 RepID=A0AAU7ZGV2_9BACT